MVAALPLKRISSLRMEFVHALLRQSDQLVGCIGVFAIDDNIERCLHIFEQQSHAMKVDRRSLLTKGRPSRSARRAASEREQLCAWAYRSKASISEGPRRTPRKGFFADLIHAPLSKKWLVGFRSSFLPLLRAKRKMEMAWS
jgi:hypothetical protein